MTLFRKLIKSVQQPRTAAKYLYKQAAWTCNRQVHNGFHRKLSSGLNIFDNNWDNLIILDGCRHDIIRQSDLPRGDHQVRVSGGSHTTEFMNHNLSGRQLDDTVWVTGNPQVSKFEDKILEVIHVWKQAWNEEQATVLPAAIHDAAIKTQQEHPNKRMVIHFVQPHYPFVGERAQQNLPQHASFNIDGIVQGDQQNSRIWTLLKKGEVTAKQVWSAYRENLKIALPAVRNLIDEIPGRTVVTSDHGNAFGEWAFPIPIRIFGHPSGFRLDSLVNIPWIIFEADHRKKIISNEHVKSNRDQEIKEDMKEKLSYLGYRN